MKKVKVEFKNFRGKASIHIYANLLFYAIFDKSTAPYYLNIRELEGREMKELKILKYGKD